MANMFSGKFWTSLGASLDKFGQVCSSLKEFGQVWISLDELSGRYSSSTRRLLKFDKKLTCLNGKRSQQNEVGI